MSHYTPQEGSVAARVIAELKRKPRVLTSGDIGKLLDLPSASVGASMKAAVQYGAVQMRVASFGARSRCEYYPNGFTPPESVVDATQRGKAQPAQPAEAQQEPVAWAVYKGDECLRVHEKREWAEDWARAEAHFGSVGPYHIRELFAAPPAQPDHQGHSCTHKCTWPQCEAAQPAPAQEPQPVSNTDELPQRLSDEMDAIAIKHAHKMALDLECILAEYGGSWYNTAMQTLGEYRSEMNAIHERESPTFMGEPLIAAAPKASHDPR